MRFVFTLHWAGERSRLAVSEGLRYRKVSLSVRKRFFAAFVPDGLSKKASIIISSVLKIGLLRTEGKKCLLSRRSLSRDVYGVLDKRLFVSSGGKKERLHIATVE